MGLLSLAGEVAQFVGCLAVGATSFWVLSRRELPVPVQIMGQQKGKMQFDLNDSVNTNNKNEGKAKEQKNEENQEKKIIPDLRDSSDLDPIKTFKNLDPDIVSGSINVNKKNTPDPTLEVIQRMSKDANFGACGGMSFPVGPEIVQRASQDRDTDATKKFDKESNTNAEESHSQKK